MPLDPAMAHDRARRRRNGERQEPWALDRLGPTHGWTPSATPDLTTAIALHVNRRPTALVLDVHDRGTQRLERSLGTHVTLFRRFEDIDFSSFELLIAVTYRRYDAPVPMLHLWARALCVGVGCTRGSDPPALAASAERLLRDEGLAQEAVRSVASARLRHDEQALIAWAGSLGASFVTFEETTLRMVPVPTPSAVVHERVGTPSVAEAAALAAAEQSELLMTKRKAALPDGNHHTLAVAVARCMQRRDRVAGADTGRGDPKPIGVRGRRPVS
jgi:hypothetical protein